VFLNVASTLKDKDKDKKDKKNEGSVTSPVVVKGKNSAIQPPSR